MAADLAVVGVRLMGVLIWRGLLVVLLPVALAVGIAAAVFRALPLFIWCEVDSTFAAFRRAWGEDPRATRMRLRSR